jgi:CheY-like chemotaxis protein
LLREEGYQLNVVMPGIDGFETCRRLKLCPETKDIPVIFLTARTEIDDLGEVLKMGAGRLRHQAIQQ